MPRFSYTAKQGPRKIVEGTVEAAHVDAAVARIAEMGMTPIDVRSSDGKSVGDPRPDTRRPRLGDRRISSFDLMLFTRKVSDLLDAGFPVLQVLKVIERQERKVAFKEVLEQIFDRVKDGTSLSDAMAQHGGIFPRVYVNMIRAGEMGGNLDVVIGRLAELLERDQETRDQLKNSLTYPAVILGVAFMTIAGIFTFVLPRILVIFEDMGQELPWPTRLIMGISYGFQHFWWLMALVVAVVVIGIRRMRKDPAGRMWMDRAVLKMPLLGDFVKVAEIGRFARCLGTLLESGVTVVKALDAVALVLDNDFMQAELKAVSHQVQSGASLAVALRSHRVFPETAAGMIAVGEESGNMAKGLYKLADYYERQTQRDMKKVGTLIEPALILTLGVAVTFILMGTLLPILNMNMMVK